MAHSDQATEQLLRAKERILAALAKTSDGLTKTELYRDVFAMNYPAARIDAAVRALVADGKVTSAAEKREVKTRRDVTVIKLATP